MPPHGSRSTSVELASAGHGTDSTDDTLIIRPVNRVRFFASYSVMCAYIFFSGVQYVVILPTASNYVLRLGGDYFFYGCVLGAYSISAIIANPLFGWLADRNKTSTRQKCSLSMSVQTSATICNMFLLAGSVMYFLGWNKWMLLASRIVAGVGTASGTTFFADLASNLPMKLQSRKTQLLSMLMLFRQLGVIAGPGFCIFMGDFNAFNLGPFEVNTENVSGLFMAVLWIVMSFFTCIGYTELSECTDSTSTVAVNVDDSRIESSETAPLLQQRSNDDSRPAPPSSAFEAMFVPEILALQAIGFFACLSQTGLEAMLPPLTLAYLNWHATEVSFFFLVAGIITVAVFLLLSSGLLFWCFSDYSLVILGLFLEMASFPFFLALAHFVPQASATVDALAFPLLSIGLAFNLVGLPLIFSCSLSLFSNAVPKQFQGSSQGLRRSLSFVGYLVGPVVGTAYLPNLVHVSFYLMLILYIVQLGLMIASKNALKASSRQVRRATEIIE